MSARTGSARSGRVRQREMLRGARLYVLQSTPRLVMSDAEVSLPDSSLRVLAYLATSQAGALRSEAGGSLWPDVSEQRAASNLRSSLWRLRKARGAIVDTAGHRLRLHPDVDVDLARATAIAESVLDGALVGTWSDWLLLIHAQDVLTGWDDEWLLVPRERFRQLRTAALETLATGLASRRRYGQAIACAMAAVEADPFRESAHRALITAHLQQGNCSAALHQYEVYTRLMTSELGLEPSSDLAALLDRCRPRRTLGGAAKMVSIDDLDRAVARRAKRVTR